MKPFLLLCRDLLRFGRLVARAFHPIDSRWLNKSKKCPFPPRWLASTRTRPRDSQEYFFQVRNMLRNTAWSGDIIGLGRTDEKGALPSSAPSICKNTRSPFPLARSHRQTNVNAPRYDSGQIYDFYQNHWRISSPQSIYLPKRAKRFDIRCKNASYTVATNMYRNLKPSRKASNRRGTGKTAKSQYRSLSRRRRIHREMMSFKK